MNFLRILILFITIIFCVSNVAADTDDSEKNIVEKAKEINQKVKKQQAEKKLAIEAEVGAAEPLPLNDLHR